MTPEQHIEQLRKYLTAVKAAAPVLSQEIAQTGVSVMVNRSIETGINKNGVPGAKAQYSTKPFPTFFYGKKVRNQGGRNYIKKNKLGTWGEFRKAQGLRNDVVNLSYNNTMWRNYGVLGNVQNGALYSTLIGMKDGSRIFEYNVNRYGDFYENTPEERKQLDGDLLFKINSISQRYL